MATLDSLPPDQRAVLQLVLQRGRSYDEIARLLSMNRANVRDRALKAFDALGPETGVGDQRRHLITDYLLGQLPPAVTSEVREHLGKSPSERAWARVLAAELSPLSAMSLPEIPTEGTTTRSVAAAPPAGVSEPERGPDKKGRFGGRRAKRTPKEPKPKKAKKERQSIFKGRREKADSAADQPTKPAEPMAASLVPDVPDRPPRSSRLGGAILIAVAIAVVLVVVILVLTGGGSKKPAVAASSTSSTAAAAGSATSSTSTSAKVVAQINLKASKAGSKAAGIAEILKEGSSDGIAIVAQNVPPNNTKPPNAYAVWLYNSGKDAYRLGFVNPGVSKNGKLSTAGGLPSNASHFKHLIVTLETSAHPTAPGTIVLQGTLTGL
jgi:hypothetical protein